MLHMYYSENGLTKWYIWHIQSFFIYGLFQGIADLFVSSCPLQDSFRPFMDKKNLNDSMKIHEMQEHKGFVDIAKWLNIQSFFFCWTFIKRKGSFEHIRMKMDLWT